MSAAGLLLALGLASGLQPVGRVIHKKLDEISGLVLGGAGDFYWVHNDSGDKPRLFALDRDFRVLPPDFEDVDPEDWNGHPLDHAAHHDWEDIARDGDTLYVADMGNNGNARRDLGVYVVPEPDPRKVRRTRALAFLPVRYPDQEGFPGARWHFDCEAMFVADGKLYFLTKHRRAGHISRFESGTKLYRLDTRHTDRENLLTLVDRRDDVLLPTGADLSPDGTRLAVSTYTALWLFERPADGDQWLQGQAYRLHVNPSRARTLEAIAWEDDESLLAANENRDVFRVAAADFTPVDGD